MSELLLSPARDLGWSRPSVFEAMTRHRRKKDTIPIVDLFAGPGGLGEGFSAFVPRNGERTFKIALSIEKEPTAHQTLELRAFFRACEKRSSRDSYYRFLRGEISRDELFTAHADEAAVARNEAWCMELREQNHEEVAPRVALAIGGYEHSILIGGPPCQAYSLVGRARNAGNPLYKAGDDKRHTLYQEYLRVLATQWPCVFVMENVKGLLSARYNEQSILNRILDDLRDPLKALHGKIRTLKRQRYTIFALGRDEEQYDAFNSVAGDLSQFVVKCEEHGIPQSRHRVILVGVREDVVSANSLSLSRTDTPTARQALADIPAVRSGLSGAPDSADAWLATLSGALTESWFRRLSGRDSRVAEEIERAVGRATRLSRGRGSEFVSGEADPELAAKWFSDPRVGGFANHSTRSHIPGDLKRYLFAAAHAAVHSKSPTLSGFPTSLLPDHENVHAGRVEGTMFADRFRVQSADRPASTITSHIAKDGHYYIHYDASQCRSLTVREAARLQTFPDNYFFCGPRTAQYQQVGNAVPPLLARQIASAIASYLG